VLEITTQAGEKRYVVLRGPARGNIKTPWLKAPLAKDPPLINLDWGAYGDFQPQRRLLMREVILTKIDTKVQFAETKNGKVETKEDAIPVEFKLPPGVLPSHESRLAPSTGKKGTTVKETLNVTINANHQLIVVGNSGTPASQSNVVIQHLELVQVVKVIEVPVFVFDHQPPLTTSGTRNGASK
jgi:hypothetical protein